MKRVLLAVIAVMAIATTASAQSVGVNESKNIVGISPFRLWNGFRVKYERVANEKYTYGAISTLYYGNFPGIQIAPIGRFYFKKNAPEGFYAQLKLVATFHNYSYTVGVYDEDNIVLLDTVEKKHRFSNFGGGIAAGYQLFWGKGDRWSVDMNLGLKFVGVVPEPETNNSFEYAAQTTFDNASWGLFGPGSIVDGLISIGYRF